MTDRTRQRHTGVAEGLDAEQVRAAIQLWRAIGRADFLQRFGVGRAVRYVVVDGLEEFDALALLVGADIGRDSPSRTPPEVLGRDRKVPFI